MYIKILLIIVIIICFYFKFVNYKQHKQLELFNYSQIKKYNLYQTYKNKDLIPQKVYDNIKKYAKNYNHLIFDDNECITFIKNNYNFSIVQAWYNLKNMAHRADLWRYCILYMYGGLYLDIKIELLQDINKTIKDKNMLYTTISSSRESIFNGVIFTPPKNPIFLKLINHMSIHSKSNVIQYTVFIDYFYKLVQKNSIYYKNKRLENAKIKMNNTPDIYLIQELCTRNKNHCYDNLDRYGVCCFMYDNHEKVIKTRYSEYPWN